MRMFSAAESPLPLLTQLTVHLRPSSSSSLSRSCGLSRELRRLSAFDLDPRLMASHQRLRLEELLRHQSRFSGRRGRRTSDSTVQEVSLLCSAERHNRKQPAATSPTPTCLSLADADVGFNPRSRPTAAPRRGSRRAKSVSVQLKDIFY